MQSQFTPPAQVQLIKISQDTLLSQNAENFLILSQGSY
jgi:hypothetical protein